LLSLIGEKKFSILTLRVNQNDLAFIKGLVEAGKVQPVIDRRYPLREAADALRYYEAGHARGKVVIAVEQKNP
jgi:NADPH:quinone reductase-like Zn-dependent oxidoreductase